VAYAQQNPAKIRAEREELQRLRDLRERLESETSDSETRQVLNEWAEELGLPERLTLADIKAGRYSDEALAARGEEVRRLLDPNHVESGADVTADDIRSWSPQRIADFGTEKALAIVNADAEAER
jgi:hypothetical protein